MCGVTQFYRKFTRAAQNTVAGHRLRNALSITSTFCAEYNLNPQIHMTYGRGSELFIICFWLSLATVVRCWLHQLSADILIYFKTHSIMMVEFSSSSGIKERYLRLWIRSAVFSICGPLNYRTTIPEVHVSRVVRYLEPPKLCGLWKQACIPFMGEGEREVLLDGCMIV